jgi:hypothetical protein
MRVLTATATAEIETLAFSANGSRLAAACKKANARVWDVGSGRGEALKGTRNADFVGFARGSDELVVAPGYELPAGLHDLGTGPVRLLGPAVGPGFCWDTALSTVASSSKTQRLPTATAWRSPRMASDWRPRASAATLASNSGTFRGGGSASHSPPPSAP